MDNPIGFASLNCSAPKDTKVSFVNFLLNEGASLKKMLMKKFGDI